MSKARRTGLSNKHFCNCSCFDGDAKLSKRKNQFLRKFRTGVKKRARQKVVKEGFPIKKKVGGLPVKHYVNLPGWVVKNLKDICKNKSQGRKKTLKSPPPMRHSMESVKEKKSSQRNMKKEQVPAEVMEIKREMAST